MTRQQAIAALDKAIANTTGIAHETLKAHKDRMIEGFAKEDADLAARIAAHKRRTREWQRSIDFRPY